MSNNLIGNKHKGVGVGVKCVGSYGLHICVRIRRI